MFASRASYRAGGKRKAMKVCIYGAGAIGGHLAARLISKGDCEVSVIARGAQLEALRTKGVTLHTADNRVISGKPAAATDDPSRLPPQDIVVVTLKAHAQSAIAAPLAKLVKPQGVALFAMNGLPWWWNHGRRDAHLELLDPGGALWRGFGPARALGGVVNSSNEVIEPGVIQASGTKRWIVGEPNGGTSARAKQIVDMFSAADLDGVLSTDIRRDIWRKIMTNISSNPIAALTRLVTKDAGTIPGLPGIAAMLIKEALQVAVRDGTDLSGEVDADAMTRPGGGRAAGKSSMLQDVEAGRPVEVEAILGQVQAFARDHAIATPTLDVVCALLRGLDLSLRLARGAG
jgi:2-dehydropantoate 2-reductase